MASLSRYFHTLRYLRPRQVVWQVWRRLRRPRPNLAPPPAFDATAANWTSPARREPSLSGSATMVFLGKTADLDELGWSGPGAEPLWRYNQHYFDDLAAHEAMARTAWHRELIGRWLAENPPGSRPGWEPYPSSLRLTNWSKWLLSGHEPVDGMIASMAVQARFLASDLEYHILGNHLLANAKALAFVGAMFEGGEADRWLTTGLRILQRELPEQVLGDGGNFERSTMYHALGFEDLLDLINLAEAKPGRIEGRIAAGWREIAAGMRYWLDTMCHPDGEIAQFNDAAIGIAPSPAELARYANALAVDSLPAPGVERLDGRVVWLRESGYVRADADEAVLFCDVAPLGPDYLPAHGHADTLSFELSIAGRRVIVNGGTSRYGVGPERVAERGTQAHSTVTIAGVDSSEVWGGFRVARRAHPFDISIRTTKGGIMIAASHDGYKHLDGAPVHRRQWLLSARSLEIVDDVAPAQPAVARFIAHPEVDVGTVGAGAFRLGAAQLSAVDGVSLVKASHSARFSEKRSTTAVCVVLERGHSRVTLAW